MHFLLSKLSPAMRRLAGYLKPYRASLALAVLAMIGAGAASSLIALLLGKLTDAGFYDKEAWIVMAAPLGLVAVAFLHGGCMFSSNYLLGRVSQAVMATLRREIYANLIRWPAPAYQRHHSGTIASKFIFEANAALSNATKSCIILVRDSCQAVALSVVLFWHNWRLAIVSLVIAPAVAYLLRYISRRMRDVMNRAQSSFANVIGDVRRVYDGHRLVKLSGAYELEEERFRTVNENVRRMMLDMTKITSMGTPVTQLICMTGVAVVLAVAMYEAHIGAITIGGFVTFLAAQLLLIPPLKNLAGVNAGFVMMRVAAESIFETIDEPSEKDDGVLTLPHCRGDVTFEHVTLRYPGAAADAVADFNLTAHAGDVVALVGLSGAGKTSVVQMLPRFFKPTAGRITLDGVDINELKLSELRRQIAIVSQDVFLFDDTIGNNILYGADGATKEDLDRAIKAAALDDFIASLPMGLDTPVGEAGAKLSGGQRQRVSIARALLKNAPVLILDEATSALDSESEAHIKDALRTLMAGRTTFIVAHRLSTIEDATLVVAMQEGRIVEAGSREELLARDGLFAKLTRLQAVNVEENPQAKGAQE